MAIEIEVQKTTHMGDMETRANFSVLVKDRDANFDFDIEGPSNLLSRSFEEIFKGIAAADGDAWDSMTRAAAGNRHFTFNGATMAAEEIRAALGTAR